MNVETGMSAALYGFAVMMVLLGAAALVQAVANYHYNRWLREYEDEDGDGKKPD